MNKNILSAALALTLITASLPARSRAEEIPKQRLEAPAATMAQAEAVLSGRAGDGSYTLSVSADGQYGAVLAAAVYEKADGKLAGVSRTKFEVNGPTEKTVTVALDGESQYVKGFFWEEDGLRPLTAALDSRTYAEPPSDDETKIPLSAANVWSSDRQTGHGAAELTDVVPGTYLAGQALTGKPLYIYADLDGMWDISRLELGFNSVNGERSYALDIYVSDDGENYRMALEDQHTNRGSDAPVSYSLNEKAAFLKIAIYGYDDKNNNWNENGWVQMNTLAAYGIPDQSAVETALEEDFAGKTGRLPVSSRNGWFAYALDEETYTDYTPSTGSDLLAEYAALPAEAGLGDGNTALRLHDRADRTSGSGRGAVGAFRELPVPVGTDYTIKFRLFIPGDSENIYWTGLSLLSESVTGGADLDPAAAVQLRLSNDNGRAVINGLSSVQFNEGSLYRLFDSSFALGRPWDVTVKVSPKGKNAEITVDDGNASETRLIGYNYTDAERVSNQTWQNAAVKYLAINTGAGGKLDFYLDDLSLSFNGEAASYEETVYYQDFESDSLEDAGIKQAVVKKNADGSTGGGSIGSSLKAEIAASNTFGGHVLKLTDSTGNDGLVVGVPLTLPDNDNKYIIRWKMQDFNPGNYSGFSLASGFNTGMTDTEHPMALQMRNSMQDGNTGIQFNKYGSVRFNDGSYTGFLGLGGNNRFKAKAATYVEMTVNPIAHVVNVSVSDGDKTLTATQSFETWASYGGYEDWSDKRPDTLIFHTGAGSGADWIIDDIEVIDTGVEERGADSAVMGLVRLESVFGTGRFMTRNGEGRPTNTESVDPNRTRFAERPGLADARAVSFESADQPGWYLCAEETNEVDHNYALTLKKLDGSAQDRAFATFYKSTAAADDAYHGSQKLYSPVWDPDRLINYDGGKNCEFAVSKPSPERNGRFYLRSEAVNYVSDNFKGSSLNGQWWTNFPWNSNNPTRDSYNFTALIDHRNVIVENGELLLKATKIGENDWSDNAKDTSGKDGVWYSNKYGKNGYYKWAGRVGVVSIQNKVYNKECLVEGSFKQPDSPIGYWNAFWLAGRDNWPPEIDVFEFLSSKFGHTSWNSNIHGEGDKGNLFGVSGMDGVDLTNDYHTFTMDWGYNYLRLYVDGKCYQQQNGANATLDYQKNLRLILNTGVGGWEAEPDGNMKWDDGLRCRWIRSFQY